MKFGVRQVSNLVFRAKQNVTIGDKAFKAGQPVLYIDTATTSALEQAATTVYAQGGRGNARLMAWEGEKTLTLTFTDALLSPIGFSILSGAHLFKNGLADDGKVHYHMSTLATADSGTGAIKLDEALAEFGDGVTICTEDAPLYVMGVEDDGSVTGELYTGATAKDKTVTCAAAKGKNVMVDYYIDLPGKSVYEADITPDTFAGYYYVEADTLFRDQASGKDMPANLTLPNVKLQSNFTITMASTGDPSTFDFTLDAFPGYTYFDKTKKVLAVLQIIPDVADAAAADHIVMPHDTDKGVQAGDAKTNDSTQGAVPGA